MLEAAREFPEVGALGAPRQVGAQAEVLANPEAQVGVGVEVHSEGEGVVEDLLVAVGRSVEEGEELALADALAAPSVLPSVG